jgi:hypothetical protein
MAQSQTVSQNGNTTQSWNLRPDSLGMAVVLEPVSGSSQVRLNSVTIQRSPIVYTLSVTVVGSGAVSFRTRHERIG